MMRSLLQWRFRPRLVPSLATAALLPVLLALGNWQLERAELKRMLVETMDERAQRAPLEIDGTRGAGGALLDQLGSVPDEQWLFQPVRVHGRYLSEQQFLLDNRTRGGRAGFEVLTPFVLRGDAGVMLINRGWVALAARRDALPDVRVSQAERALRGALMTPPSPGLKLGPGGFEAQQWPRVTQWVDVAAMGTALGGTTVLPAMLALDRAEPDGFERSAAVRTFAVPPQRHHGYAVQWFALAGTLLLLYVGLNLQRPREQ